MSFEHDYENPTLKILISKVFFKSYSITFFSPNLAKYYYFSWHQYETKLKKKFPCGLNLKMSKNGRSDLLFFVNFSSTKHFRMETKGAISTLFLGH